MGIYTSFRFYNANDPKFLEVINGTPEEREEWEDENGDIESCPGAKVELEEPIVEETGEEYGGWIIAMKDIPPEVTHIKICRS